MTTSRRIKLISKAALEKVFPDSQISTLNNSSVVHKTTPFAGIQTSAFLNSNPTHKTTLSQELEEIKKTFNLSPSELVSHSNLSSPTRVQPSSRKKIALHNFLTNT
jgi:hypothetical protein